MTRWFLLLCLFVFVYKISLVSITWPDDLYKHIWSQNSFLSFFFFFFAFLKRLKRISDWTFLKTLGARKVTPRTYHRFHLRDLSEFHPSQVSRIPWDFCICYWDNLSDLPANFTGNLRVSNLWRDPTVRKIK